MDTLLLIFFALPIAVIIFSIILEKLFNSPIAVASLIFAIFLVVTFAAFDETFLIATLAYTILSFITALIIHLLKNNKNSNLCNVLSEVLQNTNNNNNNNNESLCNTVEDLLDNSTNTNNCSCGCNRYRKNRNVI